MENVKAFQDRNVVDMCQYLSKYCELYIINVPVLSGEKVKAFHTFFPTLLVCIFGAPTKRGWIQTELNTAQTNAIRNLLSVNGHFFQALVKASAYPEYTFDLIREALPADVIKVLSSGSTHLLPKVYSNCTYIVTPSNSSAIDIRAAATRQSTLLPVIVGGDRKIRFTMLQFYLYYFVSAPTWPPLTPPPPPPTNNYNNTMAPRSTVPVNTYNTFTPKTSTYGSPKPPLSATTMQTTANTHFQIPGILRPISNGVYASILDDYLIRLIPIQSEPGFPAFIGSFFFDACLELWIRTTWIATNGKTSKDLLHFITVFVQYIVRHDLKQCFSDETVLLKRVYNDLKNELFMLISRLAFNWSKQDDYLYVMDLWSIWAAPWKLGSTPRSADTIDYCPIQSGWSKFILDNLPCYFFLVDVFLQRSAVFTFKEIAQNPNVSVSNYTENLTIGSQLRMLYRINNLLKAKGLVDFLELVEHALNQVKTGISGLPKDPFKQLAWQSYSTDGMDQQVLQKVSEAYNVLVALEGNYGIWKPKGLYAQTMLPRSDALLKTLKVINTAAGVFETKGWGLQAVNNTKSAKYAAQLRETYSNLHKTFKIVDDNHLAPSLVEQKPVNTTAINAISKPVDKEVKKNALRLRPVGASGVLVEDEIKAFKQGHTVCSHQYIPSIGVRQKQYVRSYEIASLVRWTIKVDSKINEKYNRCLPKNRRPKFLPQNISIRFIASRKNLVYTMACLLILVYILIKIIIYKWF